MNSKASTTGSGTREAAAEKAERRARILVVDDDAIIAESLAEFLTGEGFEVSTAGDGARALAMLSEAATATATRPARAFAVAIVDVTMPGISGLEVLGKIAAEHAPTAVIMLTGYGTIEGAVAAVRAGAVDFLIKPVVDTELRLALQRALRQSALAAENAALKAQLATRFGLDTIVGQDARMAKMYDLVEAVAPTKTTLLMMGESGTGKSLIARAIHQHSPRANKAYVELACGSIPETLLESELFGHVKGAFTGAHTDKVGKFLAADGGTLFLDEINSASPAMQLKLLRVLQDRKFEPVGSNQTIEVDVRVILAGNQPLEDLVAKGLFRQDLYYRINVVRVDLPPLRERLSDIPLLAEHFLRQHSAAVGRAIVAISPEAMDVLRRYPWPGNVRELSNVIERACVLTRSGTIKPEDLPGHVLAGRAVTHAGGAGLGGVGSGLAEREVIDHEHPPLGRILPGGMPLAPGRAMPLDAAMREPEKRIILDALASSGWNKAQAAERLGINRTTLYKKMKALGIDPRGGDGATSAAG
jgi:DNA-binding NtrC family response regulator